MNQPDIKALECFERNLVAPQNAERLFSLVETLLSLRDQLQFKDHDWFHEVTQHLVTLDSAASFQPKDDAEKQRIDFIIKDAINRLRQLVQIKINPS